MDATQEVNGLLSSADFNGLNFKNRVVLAPMTRAKAGLKRLPNALMAEYYKQRSNAGMVITEATVISEAGIGWNQSPGVYTDQQGEAWKQVVDAVHEAGSTIYLQLWHCGRASHSDFHDGELPLSASAIKLNGDHIHTPEGKKPYETPRAMTQADIDQTIKDYGEAARRAKEAGFDGVEVHSANGYLLDQFLQSKTNQRDDHYGGTLENRFRLLSQVIDAVKAHWDVKRIGVRLSPNGVFNDMGSPDYRETFTYAAKALNEIGVGYLHIMDGLAFGFHEQGEPMTLKEFRDVYTAGALIGNCGYTQETAEAAITSGDADFIAFGRPFIANPDLVDRFKHGYPLAEDAPMEQWYSFDEKGYADWPTYQA